MKIKIYDAYRHDVLQSGYGKMSSAIHARLVALGHEVIWQDNPDKADINLWIRPPHYVKQPYFNKEEKNVFYTMHEETTFTGWKSDWPELLNKCTAVITPTEWCKQVFIDNKVTVPVYVCPLAVDTKRYKPTEDNRFSVLMVHEALGKPGSREDWQSNLEMIKYFADQKDISFIIKTWNSEFRESLPNTTVIRFELVEEDMARLYRSSHLFVKNTRKEGWSIPMTEAMASGCTIVASDIPVLRENARDYPVNWFQFGKPGQLTDLVNQKYKEWRAKKESLTIFDWKQSVKVLDEILKQL